MAEIVIKLVNGELAGKTLQEINKTIRDNTKELSKAKIGTEEWVASHRKLESAKVLQADLKKQIDSTSKASNSLKDSFMGVLNRIPGFGALSGHLGAAKSGVGGLTSGFGLLRGAIIATGIGALIIAITAVVGWFAKTEKGANMISGAFSAMGAVIDTLMSRLWNIGETLKQLFSDPIQFFKDLGKDIASAAVEGYELVQAFDDIEDRQRDLEVRTKEQEIAVDKLLLQARNVAKTYEEKLSILAKADEMTRASYKEQLALSKEYLDTVEKEVAAAEKTGTIGDTLQDKRKDAKLAYLSLIQEEVNVEEKIANRRDQIIAKQDKALEKSSDAREKLNEKEQKELAESLAKLEDLRVKSIQDAEAREIAAVQLKAQRDLAAITLTGAQRLEAEKLIAETAGSEIQSIRDKYALAAKDKHDKEIAEKAAKDKEALDKELQAIDDAYAEKNLINLEALADQEINRSEFDKLSIENERLFNEEKLALLEASGQKETDLYRQIKERQIQIEIAAQKKIKEQAQQAFTASVQLGNLLIQAKIDSNNREVAVLEKRLESMEALNLQETADYRILQAQLLSAKKEAGEKNKRLQKTQVRINLLAEISQIWLNSSQLGWFGIILGAIQTAAALVRGNQAIKNIEAQQFALGGAVSGPSHAQGGIPGVVGSRRKPIEFEGGEFIFSKAATRSLGVSNLSKLNRSHTFASGGPVSPFTDRMPVAKGATSPNQKAVENSADMNTEILQRIETAVLEWPKKLKVINVVKDTRDGIETLNSIENDADL